LIEKQQRWRLVVIEHGRLRLGAQRLQGHSRATDRADAPRRTVMASYATEVKSVVALG
jgi:hypothetical protein